MTDNSTMSPTIGELAQALAAAHSEMPTIKKDKTATVHGKKKDGTPIQYSYQYADLSTLQEHISKYFSPHGLSIVHSSIVLREGDQSRPSIVLRSFLLHVSGEWIRSDLPVGAWENAQDLGGWLTYLKRYASSALSSVSPEDDDDANRASRLDARTGPTEKMPPCPKCSMTMRKSKDREEFYCWKAKGGCGFTMPDNPAAYIKVVDQTPAPARSTEERYEPSEEEDHDPLDQPELIAGLSDASKTLATEKQQKKMYAVVNQHAPNMNGRDVLLFWLKVDHISDCPKYRASRFIEVFEKNETKRIELLQMAAEAGY